MKKEKYKKFIKIMYITLSIIIIFLVYICLREYYIKKTNFKLIGEENINIEYGGKYEEQGYEANFGSIDLKNKVKVNYNVDINKVGNYKIEYILKSNIFYNKKTLTRKINIIDNEKPVLTVNSKDKVTITVNDKFSLPTYKAKDNYDGDLTNKVEITNNVNTKKAGTYKITYKVTDSNNNTTSKTITVEVKNKKIYNKPEIIINEREKDIKSSYIKISIEEQKLYYYENDKLIISTDVTTGKPKTPTPKGDFKVTGKARNTILKGEDYESFVSYWIAFIGRAYGIHDASWRSTFGSNLYLTEGSHGCINTPTEAVKKLYEYVKVGTPVYIK